MDAKNDPGFCYFCGSSKDVPSFLELAPEREFISAKLSQIEDMKAQIMRLDHRIAPAVHNLTKRKTSVVYEHHQEASGRHAVRDGESYLDKTLRVQRLDDACKEIEAIVGKKRDEIELKKQVLADISRRMSDASKMLARRRVVEAVLVFRAVNLQVTLPSAVQLHPPPQQEGRAHGVVLDGCSSIMEIPLPNNGDYADLSIDALSAALMHIAHLLDALSVALNIPLLHPICPFDAPNHATIAPQYNLASSYPLTPAFYVNFKNCTQQFCWLTINDLRRSVVAAGTGAGANDFVGSLHNGEDTPANRLKNNNNNNNNDPSIGISDRSHYIINEAFPTALQLLRANVVAFCLQLGIAAAPSASPSSSFSSSSAHSTQHRREKRGKSYQNHAFSSSSGTLWPPEALLLNLNEIRRFCDRKVGDRAPTTAARRKHSANHSRAGINMNSSESSGKASSCAVVPRIGKNQEQQQRKQQEQQHHHQQPLQQQQPLDGSKTISRAAPSLVGPAINVDTTNVKVSQFRNTSHCTADIQTNSDDVTTSSVSLHDHARFSAPRAVSAEGECSAESGEVDMVNGPMGGPGGENKRERLVFGCDPQSLAGKDKKGNCGMTVDDAIFDIAQRLQSLFSTSTSSSSSSPPRTESGDVSAFTVHRSERDARVAAAEGAYAQQEKEQQMNENDDQAQAQNVREEPRDLNSAHISELPQRRLPVGEVEPTVFFTKEVMHTFTNRYAFIPPPTPIPRAVPEREIRPETETFSQNQLADIAGVEKGSRISPPSLQLPRSSRDQRLRAVSIGTDLISDRYTGAGVVSPLYDSPLVHSQGDFPTESPAGSADGEERGDRIDRGRATATATEPAQKEWENPADRMLRMSGDGNNDSNDNILSIRSNDPSPLVAPGTASSIDSEHEDWEYVDWDFV